MSANMPKLNPFRARFNMFVVMALAFLFSITPVSSSAINLAWAFLFTFSVWILVDRWRNRCKIEQSAEIGRALTILMAAFLLGFASMIAMKLYWSEPVRGVSFELNAVVAVSISMVFARFWAADAWHQTTVGVGIVVASLLALAQGYGYMFMDHSGPTNAVNWGAAMALFLSLAISMVVGNHAKRSQWFAVIGVFFLVLAIFVGGRRGAFFSILWCAMVGGYLFCRNLALNRQTARRLLALLAFLVVVSLGALWANDPLVASLGRVMAAAADVKAIAGHGPDPSQLLQGSVGSRFHMLNLGLEAGSVSPWVGMGADGLARVVQRAELDLQAPLFHLHNEYLQAWVAYGVVGLLATLCFPVGLMVAGFLLRRAAPAPALAMAGLGLAHFFSGLTNVNTFHNYYGMVFAVCVALPFLTFVPRPTCDQSKVT
jgi:O-antigen ligase